MIQEQIIWDPGRAVRITVGRTVRITEGATRIRAEHYKARAPSLGVSGGIEYLEEITRVLDSVGSEVYVLYGEALRIVHASRPARENLGFSSEELSRMTLREVERDFPEAYYKALVQQLRSGGDHTAGYSALHYRKDGTSYPVELSMRECTLSGSTYIIATASSASGRDKAENRHKKTLEDLARLNRYQAVINAVTEAVHKSIDLHTVMESAVEAISTNMDDVNNICIYLREGWEAVMKAHRGYPEWFVERVRVIPFPRGFTWKTLIDGKTAYVPDAEKDTVMGLAGKDLGTKSYLSIPVKSQEETVGVININSDVKYAFGPGELRVLEIVSRQIEMAIVNAKNAESVAASEKALQETVTLLTRKEKYEKIINTISQSLHSSVDLSEVMENTVRTMGENIENADIVHIHMAEGDNAVMKAHWGHESWFADRVMSIPRPRGLTWKTIMEGMTLHVPDTDADTAIGPAGREAGIKSYVAMPVNMGKETIGCIGIASYMKNAFSEDEMNLLTIIREQIESAILNAKHVEALTVSEERYYKLTEFAPIGIFRSDAGGKGVYVNRKLCEITGITKEEAYSDGWVDRLHPEDREYVFSKWAEAVRTRTEFKEEYRFINREGNTVWVVAEAREEEGSDGEFSGYVGTLYDITDRKQAEDVVKHQAALLDVSTDAIIVRDMNHVITYINKGTEKLYGWSAAYVVGRRIFDVFYKERGEMEYRLACDELLKHGEWKGVLHHTTRDGREVVVDSRWTLVYDRNMNPSHIMGVNTDITERKELENRLLRTQRLESIGTLAGGIAHDLNNILQPIIMSLNLLRSGVKGKKYEKILSVAESSAERGADLIGHVLSFARGRDSSMQPLNAGYLISDVLKIVKQTFPKSIEIKTDIEGSTQNIVGDLTQLHQVLLNICVNARDAMNGSGEMTIETKNISVTDNRPHKYGEMTPGDYVEIAISDTGPGIPAEIRDKIFDPFFTTKEQDKGTGLGLATAYGIEKEHRGYINVESAVGKGSRFTVYLPVLSAAEQQAPGSLDEDSVPYGKGETVLIVDDESAVLDITKAIIEEFGYKALTAINGHEALDIISDDNIGIDAAVVDMMMPMIGGKAVIRSFRKKRPNIKIISVSGYQKGNELIEMDDSLLDAFLSKPYKAEALLETLHRVLHGEGD